MEIGGWCVSFLLEGHLGLVALYILCLVLLFGEEGWSPLCASTSHRVLSLATTMSKNYNKQCIQKHG
jgi:hypothetical protein